MDNGNRNKKDQDVVRAKIDAIRREHEWLSKEWDRLDRMGSQATEQKEIADRMQRLRAQHLELTGEELPPETP